MQPKLHIIFHVSLELWFGGYGERMDCSTMARRYRYWSLPWMPSALKPSQNFRQEEERTGITTKLDLCCCRRERDRGKYRAGMETQEKVLGGKQILREGKQGQSLILGEELLPSRGSCSALSQLWHSWNNQGDWPFYGPKQPALLGTHLPLSTSGAHHGKRNTQRRVTWFYHHSLFSSNTRTPALT